MKSKSNLLNYISVLLSDDDALNTFLVDPITESEGKYGITKAERAVLRRTVSHLSNKSKNGYTVSRHLGSYRRSLRLLQNVLHNVGTKMRADIKTKPTSEATSDSDSMDINIVVYYPPNVGTADLTQKTNEYIQTTYGSPYTLNDTYSVSVDSGATIEEVMSNSSLSYSTDDSGNYIVKLETDDDSITADLTTYDASDGDDYVFWFYTINGQAGVGEYGEGSLSFTEYDDLSDGDTIYWQLIAPDMTYGFQSCDPTDGAEYNS